MVNKGTPFFSEGRRASTMDESQVVPFPESPVFFCSNGFAPATSSGYVYLEWQAARIPTFSHSPPLDRIVRVLAEDISFSSVLLVKESSFTMSAEMQQIKSELENFNSSQLKHIDYQEKNTLPSKEVHVAIVEHPRPTNYSVVQQEKTHNNLIQGVEGFERQKLHRTKTEEKIVLPNAKDVATEKAQQDVIKGVESFAKDKLKKIETEEKIVLPGVEVIEQEKEMMRLIEGIETFDPAMLKHTETQEKNALPTQAEIEKEKQV